MGRASLTSFVIATGLLAGCEPDSTVGTHLDAQPTPDAAPDASVDAPPTQATCSPGTDRLVLVGAFTLDTPSIATVTTSGKVIGVGGVHAGNTVAFTVRNPFTQDVDGLGDHDVAATNMKYLGVPSGTDCASAPAGTCSGFFALAGTFTVTQVQPRYHATFSLTDLRERHDSSDQLGPAIAGTITGCIDVPAP